MSAPSAFRHSSRGFDAPFPEPRPGVPGPERAVASRGMIRSTLTTVRTRKVRRVGRFDSKLVRRALEVNNPTWIVLNHFDYVDRGVREGHYSDHAIDFLEGIELSIGRTVDWVGIGPGSFVKRDVIKGGPLFEVKANSLEGTSA